jgi:hypothetical protein
MTTKREATFDRAGTASRQSPEETIMTEHNTAVATIEEFLAIRKEAGLKIDPETAQVRWNYAQVCDPYGIDPSLPAEWDCVGREYFARSPNSEVWVWFGDLPETTRDALWQKHKRQLAFPAELEDVL